MTREAQSHQTNMEMIRSAPPEVDAGTDIPLKVRVSCPCACDLRGKTVRVIAEDSAVAKEVALTSFEEEMNETDEFTVKAPIELGECTWSVVFPAQEVGGVLHEESSTPVMFNVKPHATSMAVWDVPSPIAFNDKFKIKVGVKCSAGCNLTGKEIRIYGPKGKKVATVALGDVPWPGTSGLYWAEVGLEAPGVEGDYRWRVKLPKPDLELPHEGASYYFAFTTARPPEHLVTVEVTGEDTKAPISNAHILLRPQSGYPYRAYTDEAGMAKLEVPKGEYELYASKGDEYETLETTVEVTYEATIKAELLVREKEWWE
ncbi:MAG TPA: hypothetical protein VNA25_22985 [Phycisphaerae bacterium]|nr:hypothetical protein [Phycisphaerae bacterium]